MLVPKRGEYEQCEHKGWRPCDQASAKNPQAGSSFPFLVNQDKPQKEKNLAATKTERAQHARNRDIGRDRDQACEGKEGEVGRVRTTARSKMVESLIRLFRICLRFNVLGGEETVQRIGCFTQFLRGYVWMQGDKLLRGGTRIRWNQQGAGIPQIIGTAEVLPEISDNADFQRLTNGIPIRKH